MKKRILVVDDEEHLRLMLTMILEGKGYEVEEAESSKEALARIDKNGYDLVIADMILGGNTGLDMLREARRKGHAFPVIIMTGAPSAETVEESARLGAIDYLPKPLNTKTIVSSVSRVFGVEEG